MKFFQNMSILSKNLLVKLPKNRALIHNPYQPFKKQQKIEISPAKGLVICLPIVFFGLGCWQVKRKFWKDKRILLMENKRIDDPVYLPEDYKSNLNELHYSRIILCGTFDHSKEVYLGPRRRIYEEPTKQSSALMPPSPGSDVGYNVITPFKLEDRDLVVLVNRGWVPAKKRDPKFRKKGQVKEVVELNGVLRQSEAQPFLMGPNDATSVFYYRDIEQMAAMTDAEPLYFDAIESYKGGPIGCQTRVTLRNDHLHYAITWFSMSVFFFFTWARYVVKLV